MSHTRRLSAFAAALIVLLAVLTGVSVAAAPVRAVAATSVTGPEIKLIAAQNTIDLTSSDGAVSVDPGIWVASLGSALEFDVQRASYAKPLKITQVVHLPSGGEQRRPLPASVLESIPLGLLNFLQLTVKNSAGKAVSTSNVIFCPNSFDPERAVPTGPDSSPYPPLCEADPFPVGLVWGVQKGWAVDPLEAYGPPTLNLKPGTYHITESISSTYRKLFHISAPDATASVVAHVTTGSSTSARPNLGSAAKVPPTTQAPARSATVPQMSNPPAAALPDLVAMPSFDISTTHTSSGQDLLSFSATVWVGHAPLDVEGFRSNGSPVMNAYQYFYKNGKVVGRTSVGTMGFDNQTGHNHWHFEQFARYQLLNSVKSVAVRSEKVGFCISPTDPVDLTEPNAVWSPSTIGFTGECGLPSALWVQEYMPVGWGDTYPGDVAGNSFDITNLPNGTYYIQIAANPLGALHETTTRNDVSLRQVKLGGKPGNRTVTVPPYDGIDGE